MTLQAAQVRVAGTGEVFVAPADTAEPDGVETALPADWVGLGYTTEDGVTLSREVDREGLAVWQSITPVRYIYNSLDLTAQAVFRQSNKEIFSLYYGIPEWTTLQDTATNDYYRGEVPQLPAPDERALVIKWQDGDLITMLYMGRTEVSETGETNITRTDSVNADMTFAGLAPESQAFAVILTNDSAFTPAAP